MVHKDQINMQDGRVNFAIVFIIRIVQYLGSHMSPESIQLILAYICVMQDVMRVL